MIAAAGVSLMITAFWGLDPVILSNTSIRSVVLFVLSLVLLIKYGVKPITVMVLAGIMNVVWAVLASFL